MSVVSTHYLWRSPLRTILLTGFIAGTLDISSAILIYSAILHVISPKHLLQFIASAALGTKSFAGGYQTVILGLVFQYIIAVCFTTGYLIVFPFFPFLRKQKIISGLLYGVFIWLVMNLIVLPLFHVHQNPYTWSSVMIALLPLMLMIGLPVSLFTHRY